MIDVHAHSVPQSYLAAMKKAGITDVEGYPLPQWSEQAHLEVMARQGIGSSIISISAPGIDFLDGQAARDFARRINEDAAERRQRTKGRFGAFAILPMPDIDGALRELEYALDSLDLDGIGLLTNFRGTYLGDSAFDSLFAELDRRAATVFVHPVGPAHYQALTVGYSASVLEYPFDTTRMLVNMVSSGTLRRYQQFNLIAAHGGGTMPFLGWRFTNIAPMFNRLTPAITSEEADKQLKGVYYDCTAVTSPIPRAAYEAFVPAERRLYGSDTAFMPEFSIVAAKEDLSQMDSAERTALLSGNALKLFPKLSAMLA